MGYDWLVEGSIELRPPVPLARLTELLGQAAFHGKCQVAPWGWPNRSWPNWSHEPAGCWFRTPRRARTAKAVHRPSSICVCKIPGSSRPRSTRGSRACRQ